MTRRCAPVTSIGTGLLDVVRVNVVATMPMVSPDQGHPEPGIMYLVGSGVRGGTMSERRALSPADQRVVEELVAEHLEASCDVVLITEGTWAIHGLVAYEGEMILAEFRDRETAVLALLELAAASPGITVRSTLMQDGAL
jgi:hypothetical protein